jgi:hypothetical protein
MASSLLAWVRTPLRRGAADFEPRAVVGDALEALALSAPSTVVSEFSWLFACGRSQRKQPPSRASALTIQKRKSRCFGLAFIALWSFVVSQTLHFTLPLTESWALQSITRFDCLFQIVGESLIFLRQARSIDAKRFLSRVRR